MPLLGLQPGDTACLPWGSLPIESQFSVSSCLANMQHEFSSSFNHRFTYVWSCSSVTQHCTIRPRKDTSRSCACCCLPVCIATRGTTYVRHTNLSAWLYDLNFYQLRHALSELAPLATKCVGWVRMPPSRANCFCFELFDWLFFEPVGNFLLVQGKLLRIFNLLFRLKYFPKTLFVHYHHLLWAL